MKKITRTSLILTLLFCLLPKESLLAQGALVEISMDKQIENSELVIEGKVIAQESFWNASHTNIFTKNTVEVYKVFKGEVQDQIIVITKGGWVGSQGEEVTPSLQLQKNNVGVFMLYPSKTQFASDISNLKKYNPYSGPQAFYKYNIASNKATMVFRSYDGIEEMLYNNITSKTNADFKEVIKKNFPEKYNKIQANKSSKVIAVTSVSPSTITAGTKSVLTITGTDFGATQGFVHFRDANDGGSSDYTALDSQIISWGNTEIQVEVPARAGTGSVLVEDANVPSNTSSFSGAAIITVPFAELNSTIANIAYQRQHVDKDGDGGYNLQMTTAFDANTAAKESLIRALDSWRCETGINWTIGTPTPFDFTSQDERNVVRFALLGELEANVLAYNISYPFSCNEFGIKVYIDETDMVFAPDSEINWQYGPALASGGETDFETVAVHELGHKHELGHVIDPSVVMHFQNATQNNRVLNANDITGANDVQNRSTTIDVGCSQGLMTNHSCSLSITEDELNANISLYPNPNNGTFYIQKAPYINLEKVMLYDISGRLVSEHDISGISNIKTVNLRSASSGIYFANIHSDFGVVTKRFVIE